MKIYLLLTIIMISGCSQYNNDKQFPEQIGKYKINTVIEGDSTVKEINTLHHLTVASDKNFIVRYGGNSEDILYISEFKDVSTTKEAFRKMIQKMQYNKNLPFSFLVPMKKYENSYMTLGMGSVHYIYLSGKFLLWYSTIQKFYNELPEELIKYYPAYQ